MGCFSARSRWHLSRYLPSWFRYFSLVKIEFGNGERVVLLESLKEEQRGFLEKLGFPNPDYLIGG